MIRTIAITGASGTMGRATVKEFSRKTDSFRLRLLLRDSKKNRKLVGEWEKLGLNLDIIWGNLLDLNSVSLLIRDADVCLHLGGIVSPQADWVPEETMKVNIGGAKNIVKAINLAGQQDKTALVYIGSVSQYGPRMFPDHWGGAGDPMMPAEFDKYALSKIEAERIVAESGLKRWVSLRQSGILDYSLMFKGNDPITFHVPLNGVIEWATVEDSARLMVAISDDNVPEVVWRDFYDIGSGENFRLTNYEFEALFLNALSCPKPEKVFDPDWFATRNFHGIWYHRSDLLNSLLPFRENITVENYFRRMASHLPSYFKLAAIAPAKLIRHYMRRVAFNHRFGTLGWMKNNNEPRLKAHYGPGDTPRKWESAILPVPSRKSDSATFLPCGYDRSKRPDQLTVRDLKKVAVYRGGKLLTQLPEEQEIGDKAWNGMEWVCGLGHHFTANPATIATGGHWCPNCGYETNKSLLRVDPTLRRAWMSTHHKDEI